MHVIGLRAADGGKSTEDEILALPLGTLAPGVTGNEVSVEVPHDGTIVLVWATIYDVATGQSLSPNAAGAILAINNKPKTNNQIVSLTVIGGGGSGLDPAPKLWKVKRGDKIRGTGLSFIDNGGPSANCVIGFGLRYDDGASSD